MNANGFNKQVAAIFRQCADILRQQAANPFRINAYLRAAETLESLRDDARRILEKDGVAGLIELPAIGRGLAAAIDEIARTGRLSQLDRLHGKASPKAIFEAVPGVGPKLAHDLYDLLHVDTLEALEVAAYQGRLTEINGIGSRRAAVIKAGIAALLDRRRPRQHRHKVMPPVETLLAIDKEYRDKSAAGKLPKIAPKRFNPDAIAWLPILHTSRDGWHFTALFSNTARAHEFGRTRDWVVLYFYDDDHEEGQGTVVTETKGPLAGNRVVRGRETECRALQHPNAA